MPLSLPPLVQQHGQHMHVLSYPDRAALVQLMGSPRLQLEALRLHTPPWRQGRRFFRLAARWLGQPLEAVERAAQKRETRREAALLWEQSSRRCSVLRALRMAVLRVQGSEALAQRAPAPRLLNVVLPKGWEAALNAGLQHEA